MIEHRVQNKILNTTIWIFRALCLYIYIYTSGYFIPCIYMYKMHIINQILFLLNFFRESNPEGERIKIYLNDNNKFV